MSIEQLNNDQLEQLRHNYFYEVENHNFNAPYEVTNEVLFKFFGGISFVEDDFFN